MAHDVPARSAVVGVEASLETKWASSFRWRKAWLTCSAGDPISCIGCKSHQFVHPEDQASAIAAWVSMVTTPGTAGYWRGRYQRADGNWQWVETTNRLENPDLPVVYTSMTGVTVEEVSIEEELRARTQMLSRLSDALPVGLFEIDTARRIKFTNDRLHLIVGLPPAATIGAQLMNLADEDQLSLEFALSAVLADQLVDDIEIRTPRCLEILTPHLSLELARADRRRRCGERGHRATERRDRPGAAPQRIGDPGVSRSADVMPEPRSDTRAARHGSHRR